MNRNRMRFLGIRVSQSEFTALEIMTERQEVTKSELLRALIRREIDRLGMFPVGLIEMEGMREHAKEHEK